MPRERADRFGEVEVFVRVVELGGFSGAARELGRTPSAISKLIARLEARMGAQLLQRSTRKLQLSPEGTLLYERAKRALAELDEAEASIAAGTAPRGRLRVNANVPFGLHYVLPLVPGFLAAHPDVTLDVVLTDQTIDLLEERADIAIRTGPLRSSALIARKLAESRMVVVASPDYLRANGTPHTLEELEQHNRIGFNFARTFADWPFRTDSGMVTVAARGNVLVGDGETARRLALAGQGLARLARFHVDPDLADGSLLPVLESLNPGDTDPIHAVYVGSRMQPPARVRAFIDYLHQELRLD